MEGMFDRATAIWSALLMHQRYVLDARGMSPNETSTLAEVETGNSAMVGRGVW
jgi:hypothetical protein